MNESRTDNNIMKDFNPVNDIPEDIDHEDITVNITALVVTYNRKELLSECLNAILKQTYPVNHVIVIDNASTDGTAQMLKEEGYTELPSFIYKRAKKNLGGAGGFYESLKCAMQQDCDFIWMMDDDTIPAENCLEELIRAYETVKTQDPGRPISFMASAIYGPEGEFMNPPAISMNPSDNGYEYWYEFLDKGMISIKSSTFVSILVNRDAVLCCGFPCKDYFIWGDDTEYTTRLTTYYGDAFLSGKSVAVHKRENAKKLDIKNETDPERIKLYRYYYRNLLINRHYYNDAWLGDFIETLRGLRMAMRYIKLEPYGKEYAKAVLLGFRDGFWQYKKFKNYIDNELKNSVKARADA